LLNDQKYNISKILKLAASFLEKHGVQDPRLDSELLLGKILNLSRVEIYTDFFHPLTPFEIDKYRKFIDARAKGKPVAYILGEKPFRNLNLKVNQDVLIPRPETELVVEKAIGLAGSLGKKLIKLVDLGTGSGAIALSIAQEVPGAFVFALDVSEKAIRVAKGNAEIHGLQDKIEFVCGDLFEGLSDNLKNDIDVIVSNPPYIPSEKISKLQREIRDFEPLLALDGGDDGLDEGRRIVAKSPYFLREGGYLVLEIGEGQAGPITRLLNDSGSFDEIEVSKDYANIERVVVAKKKG